MVKVVQDVVPKRSIRHIPITRKSTPVHIPPAHGSDSVLPFRRFRFSRLAPYLFGGGVFAAIVLVISFFSGARVTVTPKTEEINVDIALKAVFNTSAPGSQADLPPGVLAFDTLSLVSEESRTVPATGEKEVQRKASGRILVFNKGGAAQRLIKNTRFETPQGLVYRIDRSIVVPAGKKGSDGNLTPGKVGAQVYADAPGERYNAGLTDFAVPGLKGSDKYEEIFGRSETRMSGGFIGTEKVVLPAAAESARQDMRASLTQGLRERAGEKATEKFAVFDDSLFLEFESLPAEGGGADLAKLSERAKLTAVIFEKQSLSKLIAAAVLPDSDPPGAIVSNLSDLGFEIKDKGGFVPGEDKSFLFSLKGKARFVYSTENEILQRTLAGRNKRELGYILAQFPGVAKLDIVIRPFWKNTFPDKPERIRILSENVL